MDISCHNNFLSESKQKPKWATLFQFTQLKNKLQAKQYADQNLIYQITKDCFCGQVVALATFKHSPAT